VNGCFYANLAPNIKDNITVIYIKEKMSKLRIKLYVQHVMSQWYLTIFTPVIDLKHEAPPGCVMVNMLTSNVIVHGFDSGQV